MKKRGIPEGQNSQGVCVCVCVSRMYMHVHVFISISEDHIDFHVMEVIISITSINFQKTPAPTWFS
jgi:hypothetical protein